MRSKISAGSSHHRGAVFSALYLVGYLSMAALALVLGVVATAWGLGLAVDLGAAAIAIVSVATLGLTLAMRADGAARPVSSFLPSATSGGAMDQ